MVLATAVQRGKGGTLLFKRAILALLLLLLSGQLLDGAGLEELSLAGQSLLGVGVGHFLGAGGEDLEGNNLYRD